MRRLPHLDLVGWVIAIAVVAVLSAATGFGILLNKIDTVVGNTNTAVNNTRTILSNGSSPTSKKLKIAATVDGDLLCSLTVPALYNAKDPFIKFTSSAIVRDCPVTVAEFHRLFPKLRVDP